MKEVNVLKSKQQNCARVICVIALSVCLIGCGLIPFHDTSDRAVDLTEVASLIGANEAAVIDKIGPPDHRITQGHADYFVYEGHLDTTLAGFVLWVPFFIGPIDDKGLDCVRLEFKYGVLQGYEIETRSIFNNRWLKDCRTVFWSAEDIEQIDPLLGTSMAKVKNTFGEPHWVVENEANIYLVYLYRHPLRNACVLLDFGGRYTLRRYEVKFCGLFGEDCPTHPHGGIEWGRLDCRQLFWTLGQLKQMGIEDPEGYSSLAGLTDEEILAKAEEGDAVAQLQVYWSTKGPKRLSWLCRSADNGYPLAQAELGRLYRWGLQDVEQNLTKAYQLYWRANKQRPDKWRHELNEALRGVFSVEMRPSSKGDLTEWQPGQCERDLVPSNSDK